MTSAEIIAECTRRGLTIGVAESLTGGLLVAALIDTPGASAVVRGGVVAYDTALKHSLLGVDAALLAERGAVDAEVARQMARGIREAVSVDGRPADIGIATTGVAGPDPQDGQPVGRVYVGLAFGDEVRAVRLDLAGGRAAIRATTVSESLSLVREMLVQRRE